jgi:hypothetical protein
MGYTKVSFMRNAIRVATRVLPTRMYPFCLINMTNTALLLLQCVPTLRATATIPPRYYFDFINNNGIISTYIKRKTFRDTFRNREEKNKPESLHVIRAITFCRV